MNIKKTSFLTKQFKKYLKNENIKIISFDIFDTLAFRKTSTPENIFYKVGNNEYVKNIYYSPEIFKNYRIQAEKKARIRNNHKEEITLKEIYDELDINKKQQKEIMKLEVQTEKENIFINHQILDWIKLAIKKNKRIIFISDMYLSKKHINEIIFSKIKNFDFKYSLYVSSEYKKSKSKTSLFKVVAKLESASFSNILHIGDNYNSDYKNPNSLNINTLFYASVNFNSSTLKLEKNYIKMPLQEFQSIRVLSSLQNLYKEKEENFYFELGAMIFGPLLWCFLHWLYKVAQNENAKSIVFLMREGKSFQKYFNILYPNFSTSLLYVSRKSTYLAGLDEQSINFEKFNIFAYRGYTIDELYGLYKISIDNKILNKYKNTTINNAHQIQIDKNNSLLDIFLDDIASKKIQIKNNIIFEKKLLKKYLSNFNLNQQTIYVDLGCMGSMFNSLKDLLCHEKSLNILFYTDSSGYENLSKNRTIAFLEYNEATKYYLKLIKRTPEFIEILLNGTDQTTIGYDNKANPILSQPIKNSSDFKKLTKNTTALNEGIFSFFSEAIRYNLPKQLPINALSKMLARLIEVPTKTEANFLQNILVDNGKGRKIVNKLITKEQIQKIQKIGISKLYENILDDLNYKRSEIYWPFGIISLIDDSYLPKQKNILEIHPNEKHIRILTNILVSSKIKKANIYGAGFLFSKLKPILAENNIKVISLMDSRAKLNEFMFENHKVKAINSCINKANPYPIIVASAEYWLEITNQIIRYLKQNNLSNDIINYKDGFIKL